jgi:hypothetical protein
MSSNYPQGDYNPNLPVQQPGGPPTGYNPPSGYQPNYPAPAGYAPPPPPQPAYVPPRPSPLGFSLALTAALLGLLILPLLTFALLGGGLTGAIILMVILSLVGIGLGVFAIRLHHGGAQPLLTLGLAAVGIALCSGWYVLAMFFWLTKPYSDGVSKTFLGR